MKKEYRNFQALLKGGEQEGQNFARCARDIGSAVAIIAPHGGSIEPGTDHIAAAIARDDFNCYLFEGLGSRHSDRTLHVTSHRFDDPVCLAVIKSCDFVLSIHGLAHSGDLVKIGGLDSELRDAVRDALGAADFNAKSIQTGGLAARDPDNICNRGALGMGVQLELARGLRRSLEGKRLDDFVCAIRRAIESQSGRVA